MRRVISLMLGELNASHMGISGPPQPAQTTLGRLAIDFDRAEYESAGRLKVSNVVPLGAAALGGIKAGDYLLQVDGRELGAHVNLDEQLDHKIGKRVVLSVASSPGGQPRWRSRGSRWCWLRTAAADSWRPISTTALSNSSSLWR